MSTKYKPTVNLPIKLSDLARQLELTEITHLLCDYIKHICTVQNKSSAKVLYDIVHYTVDKLYKDLQITTGDTKEVSETLSELVRLLKSESHGYNISDTSTQ